MHFAHTNYSYQYNGNGHCTVLTLSYFASEECRSKVAMNTTFFQ